MNKAIRQAKIEQLINQFEIATQDELMEKLKENQISATQATISRDIREMQIVKQPNEMGKVRFVRFAKVNDLDQQRLFDAIHDTVVKVEQIQFINIIHTLPSYANMLAAIVDDLQLSNIVGTLAGHDTIVLLSKDLIAATAVNKLFLGNADQSLLN